MAAKLEKDKKWKWPAENMREWTDEELTTNARDFGDRILRLRFQYTTGQTDVLLSLQQLRKGLARLKTVQRERETEKAPSK